MLHKNQKKTVVTALKFIIGIALFFAFFFLIISSINLYPLKAFVASASSAFLSFFGVPHQLVFVAEPTIVVGGVSAQITNLCAGDVEIALLFAIILATWDRSIRKRIWGCFFGFLLIMVANPLRVFAVLGAGYYAGWNVADAVHSVLFRLMLVFIIVIYYFIWYVKYEKIRAKAKSILGH
jgi:exosortase/archaeosortase family protein